MSSLQKLFGREFTQRLHVVMVDWRPEGAKRRPTAPPAPLTYPESTPKAYRTRIGTRSAVSRSALSGGLAPLT